MLNQGKVKEHMGFDLFSNLYLCIIENFYNNLNIIVGVREKIIPHTQVS